jgi:hypothetical protein
MKHAADAQTIDWVDRRDLGIARAERRARRECGDEWTLSAATYLALYARNTAVGQPFLLEDAREASAGKVTAPTNAKAWGAAVQFAVRSGWLQKAGYAPARSSNGSPKVLWRTAASGAQAAA